jgi:hypothetical protein
MEGLTFKYQITQVVGNNSMVTLITIMMLATQSNQDMSNIDQANGMSMDTGGFPSAPSSEWDGVSLGASLTPELQTQLFNHLSSCIKAAKSQG